MIKDNIHDIIKEYPDMFRLVIYKYPMDFTKNKRNKNKKNIIPNSSDRSKDISINRTKRTLHDYVRCNDFDLFVTFTFSPKKVDRYDLNAVYKKMQGWLFRQRQEYPNFKYLIVPERHKDNAIHFHALMQNYPFKLKKSKVVANGNRVYNIPEWRFGFTNATLLPADEKQKVGAYIAKYISKDMALIHNRRRYWCSKNLEIPTSHYNKLYDLNLSGHMQSTNIVQVTDYNVIYQVNKNDI